MAYRSIAGRASKNREFRLAQFAKSGYVARPRRSPFPTRMTMRLSHPATAEFVDVVSRSIQAALDALFVHEELFARLAPLSQAPHHAWDRSLAQLEATVTLWQQILDDMGERVRRCQDDFAHLETDLQQSLTAFAAGRKYLQNDACAAAEGIGT
jgi:hypothetical protein